MTNHTIPCHYCDGSGWYTMTTDCDGGTNEIQCPVCEGSRTIPDRRTLTASDRAVERIKAECKHGSDSTGLSCDFIMDIIREEEGRD